MAQAPPSGFVPHKVQEFNRRVSQELTVPPLQVQGNGSPRKDPNSLVQPTQLPPALLQQLQQQLPQQLQKHQQLQQQQQQSSQQAQQPIQKQPANANESSPQRNHQQNNVEPKQISTPIHKSQNNHEVTVRQASSNNGSPRMHDHYNRNSTSSLAAHSLQQHYGSPRPTHFEMGPRGVEYSPHRNSHGDQYASHRNSREFPPQRSSSIHGHELTNSPGKTQDFYTRQAYAQQMQQNPMGRIPSSHHEVFMRHEYYPQHMGHTGFSPPRASRFSSQEYLNSPRGQENYPDRMLQGEYGGRSHEFRQRRRSSQDLHSIGHEPPPSGM